MSNIYQDCVIYRGSQNFAKYQLPVDLLEEAFTLPAQILDAKAAAAEATAEYDLSKAEATEEESILTSLIQAEQKPDGKPKYTNAEQRAAALVEAKKASTHWVILSQNLTEKLAERNAAQDQVVFLQDRLSLIRRAMSLAAAELELLASGQFLEGATAPAPTTNNAYQAY